MQKQLLGRRSDLEIYHDGSGSIINDTGTGILKLIGNQIKIESPTGEDVAFFKIVMLSYIKIIQSDFVQQAMEHKRQAQDILLETLYLRVLLLTHLKPP